MLQIVREIGDIARLNLRIHCRPRGPADAKTRATARRMCDLHMFRLAQQNLDAPVLSRERMARILEAMLGEALRSARTALPGSRRGSACNRPFARAPMTNEQIVVSG